MGPEHVDAPSVHVGVLGPLQLTIDGAVVEVPGPGRRAVLALLALAGGRTVSVDAFIDALWPDDPPDTGAQALHSHISRLRRTLGPAAERLKRVGNGYALQLEPDEVDAFLVRRSAAVVQAQLRSNPALAAREAASALSRWRGEALSEFPDVAPLVADAVGLHELHTTLADDWLEARLALGDKTVAADAAAAVAADPLRERTTTLLMRALAAEGRTAEAMEAAARFRSRLADETGLDPGPALAALEHEVASGALAPAPAASPGGARAPVARPRGPLVGRDHDREELLRLCEGHSTVTVAGPGGVGKTRLVLDVAAELGRRGDDVVLVLLASVTEPARVPEAVASALSLRIGVDPSTASVSAALAGQSLLLVLDNCEHVVAACRELVTELQHRAPEVRVLATSRVTLHVPDEYVVRLQPLPLPRELPQAYGSPDHLAELTRQPGVQAFLEHAQRRHGGSFTLTEDNAGALVTVIRKLDGLPLAIELAAGQLAVLPVGALHDRLGRALDVLAADRPEEQARHRTLRTTIAWSYELLGDEEQELLRMLAAFPGGVDLDTVERLVPQRGRGADPLVLLSRLVDASLVAVDQQSAARYTLLDTVRAYLLDEVDARGEREQSEQTFLRRSAELARDIGRGLRGPDEPTADRRVRSELANLRAARDLARSRGDLELRIAITLALHDGGVLRDLSELWGWTRELAADPGLRGHPLEARVLGCAAESSWLLGEMDEAERLGRQGLRVAEESGADPGLTRQCWSALGVVAMFRAEFEVSEARWLRAAEIDPLPSIQLATAAMAAAYRGDREAAVRHLARAREANAHDLSASAHAYYHYAAGEAASDPGEAVREYTQARALAQSSGLTFVDGVATVGLASVWTATGDVAQAAAGFLMLLRYWPVTGNQTQLWTTVRNAALLLLDWGRHDTAALLLAAADSADSASSVGGESGSRLAEAYRRLPELLDPDELAAVRARARSLTRRELLDLAQEQLQGLRDRELSDA